MPSRYVSSPFLLSFLLPSSNLSRTPYFNAFKVKVKPFLSERKVKTVLTYLYSTAMVSFYYGTNQFSSRLYILSTFTGSACVYSVGIVNFVVLFTDVLLSCSVLCDTRAGLRHAVGSCYLLVCLSFIGLNVIINTKCNIKIRGS